MVDSLIILTIIHVWLKITQRIGYVSSAFVFQISIVYIGPKVAAFKYTTDSFVALQMNSNMLKVVLLGITTNITNETLESRANSWL